MGIDRVCFSHGQESGPWGTKIKLMAEAVRAMGCEADIPLPKPEVKESNLQIQLTPDVRDSGF